MKDTLITYIDKDGQRAATALQRRYGDIADLVAPQRLKSKDSFGGMLIIVGHGSTMVQMNRQTGLNAMLGECGSLFIVLAACEVAEVHQNIGEMQSIAQGLANLRGNAIVWGTTRNLPQAAVSNGTCFYRSPVFNWLQPANDNFAGLWKEFKKQSDEDQVSAMFPNLSVNSW